MVDIGWYLEEANEYQIPIPWYLSTYPTLYNVRTRQVSDEYHMTYVSGATSADTLSFGIFMTEYGSIYNTLVATHGAFRSVNYNVSVGRFDAVGEFVGTNVNDWYELGYTNPVAFTVAAAYAPDGSIYNIQQGNPYVGGDMLVRANYNPYNSTRPFLVAEDNSLNYSAYTVNFNERAISTFLHPGAGNPSEGNVFSHKYPTSGHISEAEYGYAYDYTAGTTYGSGGVRRTYFAMYDPYQYGMRRSILGGSIAENVSYINDYWVNKGYPDEARYAIPSASTPSSSGYTHIKVTVGVLVRDFSTEKTLDNYKLSQYYKLPEWARGSDDPTYLFSAHTSSTRFWNGWYNDYFDESGQDAIVNSGQSYVVLDNAFTGSIVQLIGEGDTRVFPQDTVWIWPTLTYTTSTDGVYTQIGFDQAGDIWNETTRILDFGDGSGQQSIGGVEGEPIQDYFSLQHTYSSTADGLTRNTVTGYTVYSEVYNNELPSTDITTANTILSAYHTRVMGVELKVSANLNPTTADTSLFHDAIVVPPRFANVTYRVGVDMVDSDDPSDLVIELNYGDDSPITSVTHEERSTYVGTTAWTYNYSFETDNIKVVPSVNVYTLEDTGRTVTDTAEIITMQYLNYEYPYMTYKYGFDQSGSLTIGSGVSETLGNAHGVVCGGTIIGTSSRFLFQNNQYVQLDQPIYSFTQLTHSATTPYNGMGSNYGNYSPEFSIYANMILPPSPQFDRSSLVQNDDGLGTNYNFAIVDVNTVTAGVTGQNMTINGIVENAANKLVWVSKQGQITCYANGIENSWSTLPEIDWEWDYTNPKYPRLGYGFSGLVDDIQVYNKALTTKEVQELFGDTSSLPHMTIDENYNVSVSGVVDEYTYSGTNYGSISGNPGTSGTVYYESFDEVSITSGMVGYWKFDATPLNLASISEVTGTDPYPQYYMDIPEGYARFYTPHGIGGRNYKQGLRVWSDVTGGTEPENTYFNFPTSFYNPANGPESPAKRMLFYSSNTTNFLTFSDLDFNVDDLADNRDLNIFELIYGIRTISGDWAVGLGPETQATLALNYVPDTTDKVYLKLYSGDAKIELGSSEVPLSNLYSNSTTRKWNSVAMTYDVDGDINVYFNGELKITSGMTTPKSIYEMRLLENYSADTNPYPMDFQMTIGEFRAYRRGLSDVEIYDLHKSTLQNISITSGITLQTPTNIKEN